MRVHAAHGRVAAFNRRGIGGGVAQLLQTPLNTAHRTRGIANSHFDHALPFTPLHDLHMRQRARDTIAPLGQASSTALSAGLVGNAENLRKQAGITGFTARMHLCQACGRFQGTALRQVIRHTHRFFLSHFRIPQGSVLALAELGSTASAAQIAYLIFRVNLADRQVIPSRLPVRCAPLVHTC